MNEDAALGPLAGVRVLDLTRFPPGAYCTVLLSDLGAEVYRVEAPGVGRMSGVVGAGLSRGKGSVAVDLRHPRGVDVLRTLARWADVLVENNRPGELDERGFGYRHAAEELPSLIWCSITGFGQDGPQALWAGHDLTYVAHSGLLTAISPDLPWYPQFMIAIPLGAAMAATGIAAALVERARTGRGCQIDISLAEAACWLLSGNDGETAGKPFQIPPTVFRRLYECGDGRFVSVAAAEPRTWRALCRGLGLDDLADDGPPRDGGKMVASRLEAAFVSRPAAEWVAVLGPLGAAVGAVNRGADLPQDPHIRARQGLVEVDGVAVPANPVRVRDLDGPRTLSRTTPPSPTGAESSEVLAAAGLAPSEIAELFELGVIAGDEL